MWGATARFAVTHCRHLLFVLPFVGADVAVTSLVVTPEGNLLLALPLLVLAVRRLLVRTAMPSENHSNPGRRHPLIPDPWLYLHASKRKTSSPQ
jgi:hypothetical protein